MPGIDELLKEIEGTNIKPKLEKLAKLCVEKLNMEYNKVIAYFDNEVAGITGRMPEGTPREKILRQAFVRTQGHYKGELLSTAVAFTGIVIGIADKFDMVRKARREAAEMWMVDQPKAIKEGYCNAEGQPLDRREVYVTSGKDNPSYGKPLAEHAFIRNIRGVAKRPDGELKRFTLPLSEANVDIDIPTMVTVEFRANIANEQPDGFKLNQWARIGFKEVKTKDPDFENIRSVIADKYEQYLSDCKSIADYHAKVAGDPQRFVLLNVDVDHVAPEPNATTKNIMMIVSDDTIEADERGVTVWVPPHLQPLEGDAGSRAIIGGSTTETVFNEEKVILVNAHAIYFFPEDLVAPMPKEEKSVQ